MRKGSKNYYDILEVTVDANQQEISQGYTRAKNAYSSDSLALYSLMTFDECEQMSDLIEEAYTVLSDPQKRILYNKARGIITTHDNGPVDMNKESSVSELVKNLTNVSDQRQQATLNDKKDITKIVATKKFALSYQVNPEFEQEIEQTTQFTGEFLKKIREYKNVDIPRMSEMTKVSKTYIKNIEEDNIAKLPVIVYVRGFVYQYAKCLKLNPDIVASSYINHLKQLKENM